MRNPDRITPFLDEIGEQWKKHPDMRFGQLMFCFFHTYGDPFHLEEEKFLYEFKKYCDGLKSVNINLSKSEAWEKFYELVTEKKGEQSPLDE